VVLGRGIGVVYLPQAMVIALRRVLGACVLALVAWPAHADTGRVELSWTAPERCPSAEAVRRRAERILGRPLSVAEGEKLTVWAAVTPPSEAQPWSVTVETDTGQRRASRTVQAASCNELANATALIVAILIDPNVGVSEPAEAPPSAQADVALPTQAPSPADVQAIDEQGRAADAVTGRSASRWSIGAMGGVLTGLVPGSTFGLGLQGAFSWKALRTSVGASFWLPARATIGAGEAQGADLQLSSAFAKLCFQIDTPTLVPALCPGAEISALRGKGFGPGVEPQARTAVFASLSAGGALLMRYSERVSLLLDVDALFPLGERQFVFAGSDPAVVYAPSVGFRLTLGAQWSF